MVLREPHRLRDSKKPLPEITAPETYIHDPDFNCDPYYNPRIYDKTFLTFKQRECTPFLEYIKQTGMNFSNFSTEPRHRPKHIQPVPDFDQDAELVTENIVDNTDNMVKSLLKNKGPYIITAPQSPQRDPTVHPIRAGTLRSPSIDIAPYFHPIENRTDRPTTEAVDPPSTTMNTETIISKPQTRRIKRFLLLEHLPCNETSFLNSQSENEVEDTRPITTDETNMQSESQPGIANDTPRQDEPRSYPTDQAAEYPSQNHTVRGTVDPLSSQGKQSENEVQDPRLSETATRNMRAESQSGDVNGTQTQDEPQSYPMAQIAGYFRQDPIPQNANFLSNSTQTQKRCCLHSWWIFRTSH